MSRAQRSMWSYLASLLNAVVVLITGMVIAPFLLDTLGDERMGVFRVAVEWLGYLALLDFGISGTLMGTVSQALSQDNRSGVIAAVTGAARAYLRMSVVAGILVVALALAAPSMVSDLSPAIAVELQWGLLASVLSQVYYPLSAFRPLADAAQRSYWNSIALSVQAVVTAVLSLIVALAGGGLVGQFAVMVLAGAILPLTLSVWATRRYPELLQRAAWRGPVPPGTYSGSILLYNLTSRVSLMSDAIIVGAVLGPIAVTQFVMTQRLLTLVHGQITAIGSVTWAALAELHHRREIVAFRHRLTQLTRLSVTLGLALLGAIALRNEGFVSAWVGPSRYGGPLLTTMTVVALLFQILTSLWSWQFTGPGRLPTLVPMMVVSMVINLSVSIAATWHFGVAGPSIGSVTAFLLVQLWWLPRLMRRELDIPLRPLFGAVLQPFAVAGPYFASVYAVTTLLPHLELGSSRLAQIAVESGAMGLISTGFLALAAVFILTRAERHELFARLRRRQTAHSG